MGNGAEFLTSVLCRHFRHVLPKKSWRRVSGKSLPWS